MEVKDVLENYTNLEKECESAKQPVSVELQVEIYLLYTVQQTYQNILIFNFILCILQEKLKKLREDWQFVKCYGENYEVPSTISVGATTKGKKNICVHFY